MPEHALSVSCEVAVTNDVAELVLAGRLVHRSVHVLRPLLRDLIGGGVRCLTLDLAGVTEVDPAGLAALVMAARMLDLVGGSVQLGAVSSQCAALMRRLHVLADRMPVASMS